MNKLSATVTLCVFAWGCAHNPPDAPDLQLELPGGYDSQQVPRPAGDYVGERWWEGFADAELDALVVEALEVNHDLLAAAARVRTADAFIRSARSAGRPGLDAIGGFARRRQNFIGFPIPGGEQDVLSSTTSVYDAGLVASWEPDLWGRIASSTHAAVADRDAAYADLQGARLSLVARVARAWFALRETRLQVELAQRTLASFEATERWLTDRYEAGLAEPLDLRLARIDVAGSAALLSERRDELGRARRTLELLLGRYPAGAVEASGELSAPPPPVPVGLPAQLLARRPDLVAAENLAIAADARVREARADLYPRLALTGDAGRSSEELDDLLDGDFSVWGVVASLSAPLYAGGRLRAAIDSAAGVRDEALETFATAVLDACGQVEDALASEALIGGRVESLAQARREAAAAELLGEELYRGGLIDVLTFLDTRRRHLVAETALLRAQRLRLDLRVDLHLALGGGFDPREATP